MFPASTKGGGMCTAFPNVCKTPAAPSPLPIPYPSIGQCSNANGDTCSQKVKILKKTCGSCKWKTVKKVKTNDSGVFKTRIYAPDKGRWKWRSKVDHSGGYGNTKGKVWTLYFD